MKTIIFASLVAMISSCSTSPDASVSNTTAVVTQIPDVGAYAVRFVAKNRCLTGPSGYDLSVPSFRGSRSYNHVACGSGVQRFLFKKNDIKAAGAFGAYLTEVRGNVVAGPSSPWTVVTNAAGQTVLRSQVSGKCLVAGASLAVVLGSCSDANAVVSAELKPFPAQDPVFGATGIVACSTDNQGNAVDCQ